jgi:hypothetical protein
MIEIANQLILVDQTHSNQRTRALLLALLRLRNLSFYQEMESRKSLLPISLCAYVDFPRLASGSNHVNYPNEVNQPHQIKTEFVKNCQHGNQEQRSTHCPVASIL